MGSAVDESWPLMRWGVAVVLASYIGFSGLKKKSLNESGAIAGFCVGLVSLGLSLRLGLTLILFYKSGSILTKVGLEKKAKLTDEYKEGGQRGAVQVLSCSLFATILAICHSIYTGAGDSLVDFESQPLGGALLCAYLGFYACCAGDTWSSELGVLSKSRPRLVIKPWTTVPPGTNGGMSLLGTVASVVAGVVMGAGFVLLGWMFRLPPPAAASQDFSRSQMPLILLGAVSGLLGSVLDSLLGAVLQASYIDTNRKVIVEKPSAAALASGDLALICGRDVLTNEQVNILSVRGSGECPLPSSDSCLRCTPREVGPCARKHRADVNGVCEGHRSRAEGSSVQAGAIGDTRNRPRQGRSRGWCAVRSAKSSESSFRSPVAYPPLLLAVTTSTKTAFQSRFPHQLLPGCRSDASPAVCAAIVPSFLLCRPC
ncbi:unnamed protein product [Scytosiphon promiscuus]